MYKFTRASLFLKNNRTRVYVPLNFYVTKTGSITSSIKYNNLKDENAINIKIKAGLMVQISSTSVP